MLINANTKIAPILKQHTAALGAIISISSKLEKLRNPLLRKVMAGRTSLAMASKFVGCSLEDFYQKLEPLGFEIDRQTEAAKEKKVQVPGWLLSLAKEQLTEFDVRPIIASGSDPLHMIMGKINGIQPGHVLKIINSFEPTPLIILLEKTGFESYTGKSSDNFVESYFYKTTELNAVERNDEQPPANDWDCVIQSFSQSVRQLDVRRLEMPQPMLTILEALDNLPDGVALYVYHKRIPVFLLPELEQRGFDYRIKEIRDGEVQLLIFRS